MKLTITLCLAAIVTALAMAAWALEILIHWR
jgi:hypothetical protein